nr:uncharacterized protein At5g19025-like [Ipomoea trifida]GMC57004.1 uncharacterized protein At5g19025-like [Ipomoea batatas]GMC67321.1 uncharacterized protein At5g19025-like [Ipomoea batatas]GMC73532.1 uncharacterized protein At5g19025-like [Ipomoea batatas]GME15461.1 uncharacterized protein At5g19025-like [Ipomoea batatas]
MVSFPISIAPSVDSTAMPKSANSLDKFRQINRAQRKIPAKNRSCEKSRSAIVDVVILIAVIGACGVLLYPYLSLLAQKFADFFEAIGGAVTEELLRAPMVYICLGLSIFFAGIALLSITVFTSKRCGKPGCKGLRKAAEFDIELQTEDCVKNLKLAGKNGVKKGLFELPRDHHLELESELKKMAPPNGRAVLVFRARCGCSVGTMEVPGPRKPRKVKK